MGAVIVGPWDGATEPKAEHGDEWADIFRTWAEFFEKELAETDQPMVPISRENVKSLAEDYRTRERNRLERLERSRPKNDRRTAQRIKSLERQLETKDRGWERFYKLRDQLKRERKGTPLDTLSLDVKTRGVLRSADIVTVEELVRITQRRNWLIRGVGPKRRGEIIDALASADEGEEG